MSTTVVNASVHVCEDTVQTFNIRDVLIAAGAHPLATDLLTISSVRVVDPNGKTVIGDSALFGRLGTSDTVTVNPAAFSPDFHGKFISYDVVIEQGAGVTFAMTMQVYIDAVNDAPVGANKLFDLGDTKPVTLTEADFGFSDPHDAVQLTSLPTPTYATPDHLKSVIITSLPPTGKLMLNGLEVAANTEVSVADITAGHLTFVPGSTGGTADVGFQVRDDGGLVGCGAADTSVAINYLTFKTPVGQGGALPTAHLGDYVWHDANANGVQDAGEAGIAGVVLDLKDTTGKVVSTTTTDANGHYQFDVAPDTYSVSVHAPAGYVVTAQAQGGNSATDSDIDASGSTAAITLAPGETNTQADAGLYKTATIGDTVWLDTNRNGTQDAGEAGVAGVKVTLLDASGNAVGASVNTDASGHYQFTNLKPGTYSVQFDKTTLPAGTSFTAQNAGADAGLDSNADATGLTAQVTLASGETNNSIDAGIVVPKAIIGDRVWEDKNANGVQDSGETGLDGVKVELKDAAGHVVSSTTTHDGGQYSFSVDAGTYTVAVTPPAGYTATAQKVGADGTTDSDIGADGSTGSVTVAAGETNNTIDAGLYRGASLGDTVWLDTNKNGVQDTGETGAAGVKVTLLDATGNAVGAAVTTDASGHYQFTGLKPGTYSVQFDKASLPAGYTFTTQNTGADAGVDSNADATGLTTQVTLASGETNNSIDAGIVAPKAIIGDRVWEDKNGNGVQDTGETGLDGVKVDLKDAAGHVVSSTTTHDGGQYSFSVDAGTYTVSVTPPAGYTATAQKVGADGSTDSDIGADGSTGTVTVAAGETNNTIDAGLYRGASLGDTVWLDTNKNGLQDTGETGAAGVKVTLLDASGNAVGAAVTTDASGHYQFTGLKPGTYSVQFDKASLPAGYTFTTQNTGADAGVDSNADATGLTAQVTLASGETNNSIDAGIVAPKAIIGDRVWEDKNGNGVQDTGETGLDGVKVDLKDAAGHVVSSTTTHDGGQYSFSVDAGTYTVSVTPPAGYTATAQKAGTDASVDSDIGADGSTGSITVAAGSTNNTIDAGLYRGASLGDTVWLDANKNGVQDTGEAGAAGVKVTLLDASGNAVGAAVTTDASGHYQFTGLKPGNYSVQFDKASLPAGYSFTTQNAGTDAGVDSNADATGLTAQVTLASGDNNTSVDAGIVAPKAIIGDRVWEDKNANGVQDAGETGLDGVKVDLKNAAGTVVSSTTTHDGGQYSFSVDAGTYTVSVTPPSGYTATAQKVGTDATIDSDIGANGSTGSITVAAGSTNNTIDAGLYRGASLGDTVWLDANRNGVQDTGEAGAAGVKVTLLDASGSAVGAAVTTDASGHYQFTGLKPGTYSVQFDKASLPAGYVFTAANQGSNTAVDSNANVDTGKTAQVTLASGDVNNTIDAGLVKVQASIGDRVWLDTNGNGIQDSGEAGIVGVKVDLKDASGNVVQTTTTGTDGKYTFTADPGKYSISVTAPTGFTATTKAVGTNGAVDSDINASGQTDQVTLTAGQNNTSVDAGFYKGATLGDRVWIDANKNGVQDSGETGLSGVKVILLDSNGVATGTTATTSADGSYSFTNLKPGTYSVQFDKTSLPTGYSFTSQNTGTDITRDSDANTITGKTGAVTLASGDSNATLDAGVVAPVVKATLGDTVWEDKNGNGVQDSGEAGIKGVTVVLKDASGATVGTTTTDASGHYSFSTNPGTYTVSVTAPKSYYFTGKDVGSNDAIDSDVGSTGVSNSVTLSSGETNNTVDAGLYKLASIGDRVWDDVNKNGIQDCGECGVSGVKITLLDANGNAVATATTDCDGNYSFDGLKPGNYSVQVDKATLPTGFSFTTALAGSDRAIDSNVDASGHSATFSLASGQTENSIDIGLLENATIGDRVWVDKNGNGVQDSGETGLKGVTVVLKNADGSINSSTTTDASGNYHFDVAAGTYSVDIKTPTGYTVTGKNVGSTSTDSNADADGHLGSVTVAAGDTNNTMDAGLYQKAEIGDKVWYDTNGDGIQQSTEAGAAGVKVTLLNSAGTVVATATTATDGTYAFKDLAPGKYSLTFGTLSGYTFTKQSQGTSDSVDSDAGADGKTGTFSVDSGVVDHSWDAGLIKTGSSGSALSSIGSKIWEDSDYDGIQDNGEAGIAGATVKLYDASGNLKATTSTDSSGNYLFDKLVAGDYKVEVTKAGYFLTKANIGSDNTIDSDFTSYNGSTSVGRTGTIHLAAGTNDQSQDGGLYRTASIGDKVWRDANHNGVQDSGEEGIGGISVSLFDSTTSKQHGTTIKTDASGNYKFADLTPGSYYLVFDKTNVKVTFASDHGTYNMSDWKWGVKNTGTNDQIDSDVVGDGKAYTNVTHTDATFLSSGENDMSWDATITPIAIDLNGDGIHTIARTAMTGTFDLLGTGKAIQTGWLSSGDGFLAIDTNGNGKIDDISELFGGASKGSGFAKLATYDSNGDGVVDINDAQFGALRVWQDVNSNGKTDAGELMTLAQAGVSSLKVTYAELPFLDENNNLHLERSSVTMNGKTVDMTDVYFNVAKADADAAGVHTATIAELLQDGTPAAALVGQAAAVATPAIYA